MGLFGGKKDNAPRLKGFTVWGFGITWDYSPTEYKLIHELFVVLENRRVLYDPFEAESPPSVLGSVQELRGELEVAMKGLATDSKAAPLLRAMQKSCRDFLRATEKQVASGTLNRAPTQRMLFDERLGAFRGVFLIYAAILSRSVGVEVHGELKKALPDID